VNPSHKILSANHQHFSQTYPPSQTHRPQKNPAYITDPENIDLVKITQTRHMTDNSTIALMMIGHVNTAQKAKYSLDQ